jgi:hypothetical protein
LGSAKVMPDERGENSADLKCGIWRGCSIEDFGDRIWHFHGIIFRYPVLRFLDTAAYLLYTGQNGGLREIATDWIRVMESASIRDGRMDEGWL